MTRYLPRSTPAALLLAAALAVSAGGGAVAGSMITGAQIQDGTVTTKDVKNGTLTSADLAPAVRSKLGKVKVLGATNEGQPVPSGGTMTVGATCPTGTVVLGGEVVFEDKVNGTVQDSGPLAGDTEGWQADVSNTGGATQLVRVVAHCANL